jgi:hypothetical protein
MPNNKRKKKGKSMTEKTKVMDQAIADMQDREGKYLTFDLAEEECGISILKIK